jgi:hypothetical protein
MTVCVVIGNFPAKIKVYTPYMGLKFRVYKYILYNSILANPSRYLCHTGLLAHLSFCVFVALLQCRREVALHACSLRVVSASHTILCVVSASHTILRVVSASHTILRLCA